MSRLMDRLTGLHALPADVARKLVDPLFHQTGSMIGGALVFMVLAIVGFVGTGSSFYLVGLAYTVLACAWRFRQSRHYIRAPRSATPAQWAGRNMLSGWATALGWGAWSLVIRLEPQPELVMMVFGMHAGLLAGGAVRNCAISAVAVGQIVLAAVPLFLVCATSGSPYLEVYAGIVLMHAFAVLALVRHLHNQTLQLLLKEEEASDLVARLEISNRDLEASNAHLETLVLTDSLTGTSNRRAFDAQLSLLWQAASMDRAELSMLLIDVDNFKAYNDLYGHQAGDACLRAVASAIGSIILKVGDMLARYGGEEFALILPDTTPQEALMVAQRVIAALAERNLEHRLSDTGRVTISVGVASCLPGMDNNQESLTGLADAALYSAKRTGRNRAHAAELPPVMRRVRCNAD